MELSDKIKKLRKEKDMTLEQVACIVGVSASTIMRYESGNIKNLRRDKIKKLADALGTTPAYLMGWEEVKDYADNILSPKIKALNETSSSKKQTSKIKTSDLGIPAFEKIDILYAFSLILEQLGYSYHFEKGLDNKIIFSTPKNDYYVIDDDLDNLISS